MTYSASSTSTTTKYAGLQSTWDETRTYIIHQIDNINQNNENKKYENKNITWNKWNIKIYSFKKYWYINKI
jgi:hypothetical protein